MALAVCTAQLVVPVHGQFRQLTAPWVLRVSKWPQIEPLARPHGQRVCCLQEGASRGEGSRSRPHPPAGGAAEQGGSILEALSSLVC